MFISTVNPTNNTLFHETKSNEKKIRKSTDAVLFELRDEFYSVPFGDKTPVRGRNHQVLLNSSNDPETIMLKKDSYPYQEKSLSKHFCLNLKDMATFKRDNNIWKQKFSDFSDDFSCWIPAVSSNQDYGISLHKPPETDSGLFSYNPLWTCNHIALYILQAGIPDMKSLLEGIPQVRISQAVAELLIKHGFKEIPSKGYLTSVEKWIPQK